MARDNQSLVTLTPPTWKTAVSWTSAATSRGTKKIRRMVSAFGIFIAQTNYIKSVRGGSGQSHGPGSRPVPDPRVVETAQHPTSCGVLYLYFAHESIAPPFFLRQSRAAL